MENVSLKIRTILLISFFGMCLIGCTGSITKKDDVIGKWMAIGREPGIPGRSGQVGFIIEFFEDNTVTLPSGKRTWSITREDGRVRIDDPELSMIGSLKDDILTITMSDETKVLFRKQK